MRCAGVRSWSEAPARSAAAARPTHVLRRLQRRAALVEQRAVVIVGAELRALLRAGDQPDTPAELALEQLLLALEALEV